MGFVTKLKLSMEKLKEYKTYMEKKMKVQTILKKIGQAFETPFKERTPSQINITSKGICYALYQLAIHLNRVDRALMRRIIDTDCGFIGKKVFYPTRTNAFIWDLEDSSEKFNNKYDQYRATYCYLLSMLSIEELTGIALQP